MDRLDSFDEGTTLRVLADLALGAVRLRLDGPFVAWLGARSLDPRAAGRAEIAALRRLVPPRWVRRAIAAGFLRDDDRHGRAYYLGAGKLAALLGLPRVRAAGFVVPLKRLVVGAALRRGRLALGAIAALRRGKPISIMGIAEETGVSPQSVSAWLKATRWPRRRRQEVLPGAVTEKTLRWLRAAQAEGEPVVIVKRRGRLRIARRLPSVLQERWERESRSWQARRINDAVRPASSAPLRALRGAAAGRHPTESKNTSSPGEAPPPPSGPAHRRSAEEVDQDFARGSWGVAGPLTESELLDFDPIVAAGIGGSP
jgi:hypothetical protein